MNTERDPQDVEGVLLDVKLAKARNDALEEAAELMESLADGLSPIRLVIVAFASHIRALKVQP